MYGLCCRSGTRLAMATVCDHGCREPHEDFGVSQPAVAEDGWQVDFTGEVAVSGPEEQQQALASVVERDYLGYLDRGCREPHQDFGIEPHAAAEENRW